MTYAVITVTQRVAISELVRRNDWTLPGVYAFPAEPGAEPEKVLTHFRRILKIPKSKSDFAVRIDFSETFPPNARAVGAGYLPEEHVSQPSERAMC
jgi:hypothetical protein